MNRPTLTELANKHGTDKGTTFPGHHVHGYTDAYAKYLDCIRDEPIDFLEIGVVLEGTAGGQSTRMWEEYFTKARIVAFDIAPIGHLATERVKTIQGDMSDGYDLAHIEPTMFDVILDDGSHKSEHQVFCLKQMHYRVKPGGLYIIEDLSIPGIPNSCGLNNVETTRKLLEFADWHCGAASVHFHDDMKGQFRTCIIEKLK